MDLTLHGAFPCALRDGGIGGAGHLVALSEPLILLFLAIGLNNRNSLAVIALKGSTPLLEVG